MIRLLAALALCGCPGEGPERPPQPLGAQWDLYRYPLSIVLAPDLSPCEVAAVEASLALHESYQDRRLALIRTASAQEVSVHGLPPLGVIAVTSAPPGSPGAVEEATVHADAAGDRIHSVDLRVSGCDVRAVAHGLGHALGWGHATGPGWLMSRSHDSGAWRHQQE